MPVFTGTPGDDFIGGTNGDDVISGLAGHDNLVGGPASTDVGNDVIDGGDDNDIIRGRGGNDTLTGGNGHDYLQGGEGDDVVDGGAGFDRAAFVLIPTDPQVGATVDLNIQGVAQDTGHGFDTLIGIEHVSGTALDDVLTGDGGANWIWGEGGMDVLSGGGGDDLIEVGQGDATADGGSGADTISFFNNQDFVGGVTVDLNLQGGVQTVYLGSDMTLSGFENVSGSSHADSITGDAADNVLLGAGAADSLSGGAGNDSLYGDGQMRPDTQPIGGSGPITLYQDIDAELGTAEDGDDTLSGGAGSDFLHGGGGTDTASFADLTEGVQVVLGASSGFAEGLVSGDIDTLVSIENAIGSDFDDFLVGNAANNVLTGGDGVDILRGLAGDDTLNGGLSHDNLHGREGADTLNGDDGDDYLRGGEGDDLINGGAGFDRAAFVTLDPGALLVGATVDLNIVGAQNTGHGFDTLTGIEHVSGTDFDDTLTGDGGANWLWGEGGIDVLTGNGGDDLLEAGEGTSTLSGGAGTGDTASFYDAELSFLSGVTVSLAAAGAQAIAAGSTTTLSGIENLSGSVANDTLTGSNAANTLAGQEGNDTLNGGDGNDLLLGDGHITVDTHGTGFSGPIVTIEDVSTDGFSVAGNDSLNGGKGDDRLVGGAGNDTLSGDQGHDVFAFAGGSGDDVVTDYNKAHDSFELTDWGAYTVTQVGKDVLIDNGTDSILVLKAKASDVSADITASSSFSARLAPASAPADDGADGHRGGWAEQGFAAQHGFRADGQAHHDWHFG